MQVQDHLAQYPYYLMNKNMPKIRECPCDRGRTGTQPSTPPIMLLFHKPFSGIKFSLNNISLPLFHILTYTEEMSL